MHRPLQNADHAAMTPKANRSNSCPHHHDAGSARGEPAAVAVRRQADDHRSRGGSAEALAAAPNEPNRPAPHPDHAGAQTDARQAGQRRERREPRQIRGRRRPRSLDRLYTTCTRSDSSPSASVEIRRRAATTSRTLTNPGSAKAVPEYISSLTRWMPLAATKSTSFSRSAHGDVVPSGLESRPSAQAADGHHHGGHADAPRRRASRPASARADGHRRGRQGRRRAGGARGPDPVDPRPRPPAPAPKTSPPRDETAPPQAPRPSGEGEEGEGERGAWGRRGEGGAGSGGPPPPPGGRRQTGFGLKAALAAEPQSCIGCKDSTCLYACGWCFAGVNSPNL